MPILLKMNLGCNFQCTYCYQRTFRPEEEIINYKKVDETILRLWEKGGGKDPKTGRMKVDDHGNYKGPTITLHGGEPTILPFKDFKKYLKLIHRLTGKSGIQTNGYNITDKMIPLFKKYKTHVGFSLDGPWPLNELRGVGTEAERKAQTEKIIWNMKRLEEEDISMSVIAVIHKHNALGERRETLKNWIEELTERGITGRLNPCCTGIEDIDLTIEEAIEAYTDLYDFMIEKGFWQWSPFKDIINSFKGSREVVCAYRRCDPHCTSSATTVLHDGSVGVCLRLHVDGKVYTRVEPTVHTRSEILSQSDCKDCEWWQHCYGGCSGLAIDFDWRNKDRFCELRKALFKKTKSLMNSMRLRDLTLVDENGKTRQRPRKLANLPPNHYDAIIHSDGETIYQDSDKKEFP